MKLRNITLIFITAILCTFLLAPGAQARSPAKWMKKHSWTEAGNSLFYYQFRPKFMNKGTVQAVWWDEKTYKSGWDRESVMITKRASIPHVDFASHMAVALYRQVGGAGVTFKIDRITETAYGVSVYYTLTIANPKARKFNKLQKLITIKRCIKPVVFYENDKKVAEVLPLRKIKVEQPHNLKPIKEKYTVIHNETNFMKDICSSYSHSGDMKKAATADFLRKRKTDWMKSLSIDFKKEMILAAFKGYGDTARIYKIVRAAVIEKQVHVYILHVPSKNEVMAYPYDLAVCLKRGLPVVFYENGKKANEFGEGKKIKDPKQVKTVPVTPQSRWTEGEKAIEAVDAASGKVMWRAKLRFAVGRVTEEGDTWIVYSLDKRMSAKLDARTGKTISISKYSPRVDPKQAQREKKIHSLLGRARMYVPIAERAIKRGRKEEGLKYCTWISTYAHELALLGKEAEAEKYLKIVQKLKAMLEKAPGPAPKKEDDIF